jgi:hypothetical protein
MIRVKVSELKEGDVMQPTNRVVIANARKSHRSGYHIVELEDRYTEYSREFRSGTIITIDREV